MRDNYCHANSVRPTSSIRADMIFGRDKDHNDQTDEIDEPMHVPLLRLLPARLHTQNRRKRRKFLSQRLCDALELSNSRPG